MKPSPHDIVVSEAGEIATLVQHLPSSRGGGWTAVGHTDWLRDDALHIGWRILTSDGARYAYEAGLAVRIDPPAPATEVVPWHEAVGRTLPDGFEVQRVTRWAHGDTYLSVGDACAVDVDGETVEVLAR